MKRSYFGTIVLTLAVLAAGLYLATRIDPTLNRALAQQPATAPSLETPRSAPAQPAPDNHEWQWPILHTTAARQVMFEVLIMEIDARKLHAKDFHLAKELGVEDRPQPSPETPSPIVAALSEREFRLLSRGLTLTEAAKVISRPSVVTTGGRTAKIHSGGEVPLITVDSIFNGKRTKSVDTRAFGAICEITPHFVSDDTLRVEATVEISELTKTKDGLPGIVARKTQVTGQVKFGQVLVVCEGDDKEFRGAGQDLTLTAPPAAPGVAGAPAKREDSLLLVAITPASVDALPTQQEAVGEASAFGPQHAPHVAATRAFADPAEPDEGAAVDDASAPEGAANAKPLQNYELVVSQGDMVVNVHALAPRAGRDNVHVDLYGRDRDDDLKGADSYEAVDKFASLHSVLKHVALRRVFAQDGKVTLHLALSPRDVERLDLARRHCHIIPMPSDANDAPGLGPSLTNDAENFPQATPAPLRDELQSLRDEVRGLRGDVQRILELLQQGG
ncbi:MAG: hypothetical protein RIC55_09915 [Pirellulaceae bacterium]